MLGCMPCLLCAVHTTQPVHLYQSIRSLHFISPTAANQHNPPRSSLPGSRCPLNSSVFPSIAGSLDMLCPNLLSLMCITHAPTQLIKTLLDKGIHPDEQRDEVRILLLRVRSACTSVWFASQPYLPLRAVVSCVGLALDVRVAV